MSQVASQPSRERRSAATSPSTNTEGGRDRFAAGCAAAFLALLFLSEIASRLLAQSGFLYDRLDFAGSLTSLPELQDRIRWACRRPRAAVLLGDSVLGASALLERGEPAARRRTIAAFLRETSAPRGWAVASLSADGLLLPDIDAIAQQLRAVPPRRVVLFLNVRMFGAEFQETSRSASRDFLRASGPAGAAADTARQARSLDQRLGDWVSIHWCLFRTTQLLKTLWYFPTQRDALQRAVTRLLGDHGDRDLQDAALALKISPYYQNLWRTSDPSFQSLGRIVAALGQTAGGLTVVLSPQNPGFAGSSVDPLILERNRETLRSFLRLRERSSVTFLDWSDRYSSEWFLDQCHLTASGNQRLARDLFDALEGLGS